MKGSATDYYIANQALCAEQISKYERLINGYSFLRLFSILLGVLLVYQSFKFQLVWFTEMVIIIVVIVFAWLVRNQSVFEKRKNYFTDLSRINKNELNSIDKKENIYPDGSIWINDLHPYSSDLDIFGKGSLFKLINRCSTSLGNKRLADWLKEPASATVIRERQAAVQELAAKPAWKQDFQTVLLFSNTSAEDYADKLFQYMELAPGKDTYWLRFYIRWIPWGFLAIALISWYIHFLILIILAIGISNLFIMQTYKGQVAKTDSLIGKVSSILGQFSEAISDIKKAEWESALCLQLAADLKDERGKLSEQIKHLSVLIKRLAFSFSFAGPVLNFIMVWDVRQFFAIEDWKRDSKVNLQQAFDVIASFEALISMSSLNSNYPAWSFPKIEEHEQFTLTSKAIGHPLIPDHVRVDNDFTLCNELKIDIITGSNMAGKSTFLRTLGMNTILALSGAPVCATEMSLTPMLIFSYMRITDSLNESTSTFKAELDRLRSLLEVLGQKLKVYFLIDEMLRGTNSTDKYLGSKAIIEKLISQKAVGIIATHDLQIAQLEQKYPDYIRNFYFNIQVEGDEMHFDYKLKTGECKTFNASMLLRKLGIYTDS